MTRWLQARARIDRAEGVPSRREFSHFENAPDHKLSALRRYVAALGGELEVATVIGGRRFPLSGV